LKDIPILFKDKRRLKWIVFLTAFKDEEVKIFGSSQGTRRNREENPVDILDFTTRSRDRRSYQ